jgi:integrase-like protein
MDLFVVPTIGFDLLYAFVIVGLGRRNLVWINVTTNPTTEWIARQLTEAFPWNEASRYLIRDRDRIYGSIVTRRMRAMGIRDKPSAPASPWQNGFAERLIGSIRRECVDHFIVLGEAHLRRILRTYARYYNNIRTHWSLDKDEFSGSDQSIHTRSWADFIITTFAFRFSVHTVTPISPIEKMDAFLTAVSRPVQPIGSIKSHPILGGLHHHYVRVSECPLMTRHSGWYSCWNQTSGAGGQKLMPSQAFTCSCRSPAKASGPPCAVISPRLST